MKLTIGMIVKNEERYLDKCLSSIKPILDNVDSELIITDTGSTDRTAEIARKYTDKVLHFDWINDFAAARNFGLEKAQGEWFMAIDGDDVWESCDDIISFFNSGEYKKYHCASYIYRNIHDLENYTFSDQYVVRMAEKTSELKYIGKIHENLSPLMEPVRLLTDIVDHYGYLYDEENNAEEKARRNETMLLEELDSTPDDDSRKPFLYYYLFESVRNVAPERAEKYIDVGIDLSLKKGNDAVIMFFADKIGILFPNERYIELLELCDKYFCLNKKYHYNADAEMYAAKALSLANLGRNNEAYEAFQKFFSAFELMKKSGSENKDKFVLSPVLASDSNFLNIVMKFMNCCTEIGKLYELSEFLKNTELAEHSFNDQTVSYIVQNEVALMVRIGYGNAADYYKNLNGFGRTVMRNSLCNILFADGKKSEALSALKDISGDDTALSEKLDIYSSYFIEGAVSEDAICTFAERHGMDGNHDLLCIMMQCGMDISRLFGISDFDPMICVKRCCDYIVGFYDAAAGYSVDYISDISALPTAAKIYEYCMKCAISNSCDISSLIEVYAGIGRRYSGSVKEEMPPEINAACLISKSEEHRKQGRFKECFAEMKAAVECYPNISPVVAKYRDIVAAEFENSRKPVENAEMKQLALMLKTNVRNLAEHGKYDDARKFLNEYAKIAPNDPEIPELYKLLN